MSKHEKIIIKQAGALELEFKSCINTKNQKEYLMPDCTPLVEEWKKSERYFEIKQDPEGKSEHPGSRVNDVFNVQLNKFDDGLDVVRHIGFQTVNPNNLYKLKSGQHAGKYMPANVFEMNERKYIVNQSPFYVDNYYRMIIEENIKMIVSLARPGVDVINYYREGFILGIHSLELNEVLEVDDYKVECVEIIDQKLSDKNTVHVKSIKLSSDAEIRYVTFIDCRDWADIGSMNVSGLVGLANLMDSIVHKINPDNPREVRGAFNCAYGFGRAPTALLLWEFKDAIRNAIALKHNVSPKGLNIMDYPEDVMMIDIDFNSFISYMCANIMGGASMVHREQMQEYLKELKNQAKAVLEDKLHNPNLDARTRQETREFLNSFAQYQIQ